MFVLKERLAVVMIIVFFCNGVPADKIQLPAVPCPDVFKYEFDGNKYVGIITLRNVSYGQTKIQVEMEYPGVMNHDFSGVLLMVSEKDKIVDYISTAKPIIFWAEFPQQNVVPRVNDIIVNDVKICFVSKDYANHFLHIYPNTILNMKYTLTIDTRLAEGSKHSSFLKPESNQSNKKSIEHVNRFRRAAMSANPFLRNMSTLGGSASMHDNPFLRDSMSRFQSPAQSISQNRKPMNIRLIIKAISSVGGLFQIVTRNQTSTHTSALVQQNPFFRNPMNRANSGSAQTVPITLPPMNTRPTLQENFLVRNIMNGFGSPYQTVQRNLPIPNTSPQVQQNPFLRNAMNRANSDSSQTVPHNLSPTNIRPTVKENYLNILTGFSGPYQTGLQNQMSINTSPLSQENPFLRNSMNRPNSTSAQILPSTNARPQVQENPLIRDNMDRSNVTVPPVPKTSPSINRITNTKPATGSQKHKNLDPFCGRENNADVRELIAHGHPVAPSRFPWIVAIYTINEDLMKFKCGGNLISSRTVISAGHCFQESGFVTIEITNLLLSIGRHNLSEWDDAINIGVQKLFIHPDFRKDPVNLDADLAIAILKQSVSFSPKVHPICLWEGPTDDTAIEGTTGNIVGWGEDVPRTGISAVPQMVNATIVSESTCIRSNHQLFYLTSNRTLCAGNRDGSGPCKGDSGSGLMVRIGNQWMLRAIVSASLADDALECNLNEYVIFSDVAKFKEWIKSHMIL